MGEKLKEHWQVAFITAFAVVVLSLGGQAAWSAMVKTNKSATVEYVNTVSEGDRKYTRETIKAHVETEDAKINTVMTLVKSMDKKIDILLGSRIND